MPCVPVKNEKQINPRYDYVIFIFNILGCEIIIGHYKTIIHKGVFTPDGEKINLIILYF